MKFAYEKLEVWNRAVEFAVQVVEAVDQNSKGRTHYRLLEQIEASSASVAANIAEGKGRISKKEFVSFQLLIFAVSFKLSTFSLP